MTIRARLRLVAPAIAVALVLAALPATASAAPGWLSAQSLTSAPVPTTNFSLGTATDMDDDGNSLAAWVGYVDGQTRVFASRREAGGSWQATQQVATAPGIRTNTLTVKLADDGSGAIGWQAGDPGGCCAEWPYVLHRDANGTWGTVHELNGGPAGRGASRRPFIGFDRDGNLSAVWSQGADIYTSTRAATTGIWGTAVLLGPGGFADGGVTAYDIDVAPSGAAAVAWVNPTVVAGGHPSGTGHVLVATRAASGPEWSASTVYASSSGESHRSDTSYPNVELASTGDVLVAWREDRYSPTSPSYWSFDWNWRAASRAAGSGAWSAPVDLSPQNPGQGNHLHMTSDGSGSEAMPIAMEMDGDGDATALWGRFSADAPRLETRDFDPSTGWTERADLWTGGSYQFGLHRPWIAMNEDGDAVAAFAVHGAQYGWNTDFSVLGASREAGGAWTTPTAAITETNIRYFFVTSGIDEQGNGVVGWSRDVSEHDRRPQAVGFDAAGPRLRNLVAPDGAPNQELQFGVEAVDVWSAIEGPVSWTFGDGGTATGTAPTHTYTASGQYDVSVQATDTRGNPSTRSTQVRIAAANQKPTAAFTITPESAATGADVTFDAGGSSDPDAGQTIAKYEWDLDGDETFETDSGGADELTTQYDRPGTYDVALRVTDTSGAVSDVVEHDVTITNRAPSATLAVTPTTAQTGQQVEFSGVGSADPDGSIATYQWDLDGNGSFERTTTAATTTRTYSSASTLDVRLRVRDDQGDSSDPITRRLTIEASPGAPPPAQEEPPAQTEQPPGDAPQTHEMPRELRLTVSPVRVLSTRRERAVPNVVGKDVDVAREVLDKAHYVRYQIDWSHKKPADRSPGIGDVIAQNPVAGTQVDSGVGDFLRMELRVYAGPVDRKRGCGPGFKESLEGMPLDLGRRLIAETNCVEDPDYQFRFDKTVDEPTFRRVVRDGEEYDLVVGVPRKIEHHDLFLVFREKHPRFVNNHTFGDDWKLAAGKKANCFQVQVIDRSRSLVQNAEIRIDASDAGGSDPARHLTDATGGAEFCTVLPRPTAAGIDVVVWAVGRNKQIIFGAAQIDVIERKRDYRSSIGRTIDNDSGRYVSAAQARAAGLGWLDQLVSWVLENDTVRDWATSNYPDAVRYQDEQKVVREAIEKEGWATANKKHGVLPGHMNAGRPLGSGPGRFEIKPGQLTTMGTCELIASSVCGGLSPAAVARQIVDRLGSGKMTFNDVAKVIAAGGGNITGDQLAKVIAAGGGNVIAAGGGNVIAPGGLNFSPQQLAQVIAAGGGNVIAAGGGNVIAAGGGNLTVPEMAGVIAAGGGNLLSLDAAGKVIAAGGGNFTPTAFSGVIAAGGGNFAAQEAMGVIAAGGGNFNASQLQSFVDAALRPNAAGSAVIAAGGGNVIAAGGGNVIAAGGGNVIAAGGGNVIAAGGGNVIAAGGGNLTGQPRARARAAGAPAARAAQAESGRGSAGTSTGTVVVLPVNGGAVISRDGQLQFGDGTVTDEIKNARQYDVVPFGNNYVLMKAG